MSRHARVESGSVESNKDVETSSTPHTHSHTLLSVFQTINNLRQGIKGRSSVM